MKNAVTKFIHTPFRADVFRTRRRGAITIELLISLLVLSFIIRPTFVQTEDMWGERTTQVEWELPMAELVAHVGNLQSFIDQSWAGLDRQFGYKGPSMGAAAGKLMVASLKNGVPLMTAGFVDSDGRFTGDFSNNLETFQTAAEGMTTAYYVAAMEGMER